MSNRFELLSPAGDMERLRMALLYGADAVYLAGRRFGMRAAAVNFGDEALRRAVALVHGRGAKIYVTCNTLPREDELRELPAYLEFLQDAGVDALIIADLGVLALARRHAPRVARHVSTQFGVINSAAANALYALGADTVVLARETPLEDIRKIRANTPPELRLEAFVHGAMCVSYSGRCLLSNYMADRDAQRGMCAQPCRYQYALMEEKRPGEYFPVYEENNETFIMNSRDMCMIDHIPDLMEAGLDSLKIEGRAKSAYYAAVVTGAYRRAVDAARAGEALDPVWRAELDKVSHRPYSTGFYYGPPGQYTGSARYIRDYQVCAVVETCDGAGNAVLSLRNKFSAGDSVELMGPGLRPVEFEAPPMEDTDGLPLMEPRRPEMKFRMRLPAAAKPLSLLRRRVDLSPKGTE